MKRRFTILTAALALLTFLAVPMGMWGQTKAEVVAYTLEPAAGSNSNYASNCDIAINGITWNLTGNSQMIPWRIGGKSLSGVNRTLYSKTAISDNISKIEVTHGTASSITVNSWTVIVASDASFNNVVSTLTPTFAASTTTTINRPTGADWSNCYFKFVYNVSVSVSSNKFIQFSEAKFYREEGAGTVIATPTFSPAGGEYTTAQNVTISCETQGASIYYTTNGSTPDNTSTQYTTAISVSSTTTINAIAYVGSDASNVATATYNIVQPLATMQAIFDKATEVNTTATYVYITLDDWVVSGVSTNGKNVFVTDGTKGFVIFDNGGNMGFTAGDVLSGTVYCKVQLYNGFAELTQLNSTTSGLSITTGGTVSTANIAMADLAGVNTGALLHYDNLTCSIDDNKYYLSDGTTTLQVYNAIYAFGSVFVADHVYNITGVYQQYNNTKEILPRSADDIEEVVVVEPSVIVTPNTISAPFAGAEGTLALTYENIEEFISFDYYFCDANGNELEDTDPDYPGDWIDAEINEENEAYTLSYIIEANDGAARTAYMKVYTFDDNLEEVYAIVTVSQAQYVVDYAELPFEWEGGASADLLALNGVTAHSLGSDYASGNAPYLIKFDNTGDYIQVKCDQQPGKVTIDVKMIGGGNTSTITIQGSADGETFTDVEELTISGAQNDVLTLETTNAFAANVRYVRMLFTKGSNVGVGPISIAVVSNEASIAVNPDEVNVDAEEHDGTLDLTYENLTITEMGDFDIQYYDAVGTETSEPDWIEVLVAEQDLQIGEGYVVSYYMVENEGTEARTAYFKVYAMDDETNLVYSNLVTVTQAAPVVPPTPGNWVLTSLSDLTEDDIFVIVGDDGNTYALPNDLITSGSPAAVSVTVVNNTLSEEPAANLQWNLESTEDGYVFYPNGDTENWLYFTNSNSGVRVGTGDAKHFTFDEDYGSGYLTTTETTDQRWLGIYSSQDWRCYKLGSNGAFPTNIAGQSFAFYKKVVEPVTETYTLENITGYTGEKDHYYLIASPVTVDPEDVVGMTEGDFDLYYFDESEDDEWRNYEAGVFNLEPGKGYLYAKKAIDLNQTYSFVLTGIPYAGTGTVSLDYTENAEFPGFNLIGNPFGTNANLDLPFYRLNQDGSALNTTTEQSQINVMEGVFVQATAATRTANFTQATGAKRISQLNVKVTRNRSAVLDNAIIRFDDGATLGKFQLNPNDTKIYITEGNQDYAIVRSANAGEMPVSFKAAENGNYTLSIETENVEVSYLHLIDNMTGADVDLMATPSYSFNARTTDNANRFRLMFNTNGVDENTTTANFAYFNGSSWTISNMGEATLQVVDMMGRVISTQAISGNTDVNLNQAAGVYMLRLVNGENVMVQKVVVR